MGKGQVGWKGEKKDPLKVHFTLPPLVGSQAKPATDLLHHPGESLDPLKPPLLHQSEDVGLEDLQGPSELLETGFF